MSPHLSALAALLLALPFGAQAVTDCTAANANAYVIETTPTSAFTDNNDGTVTHALTGLMWKQCAQGQSGASCASGSASTLSWSDALKAAVADGTAEHTDWRLPNKKELESIVEFCGSYPAINQTLFPATPASSFWSASSYVPGPANAWLVFFNLGDTHALDKSLLTYVRLVRGGQSFDSFDALGGPTGLLNDTGQTQCNDGTGVMVTCDASATGNASPRPRQDGRFGRDVASHSKVGGGAAGFDFSKVCMDGTLNCAAAADTSASPASAAAWACTKDNVTNLIWSLYSGQGNWTTYARTTLPNADNAQSRCGFNSGWRLPARRELLSIVHYDGQRPSIDSNYFPATQADWYWTNDPYQPDPADAWFVYFVNGGTGADVTTVPGYVRLVRSGQ